MNKKTIWLFLLNHSIGQVFFYQKIYENSAKLYAFCRVLDDIADEKLI